MEENMLDKALGWIRGLTELGVALIKKNIQNNRYKDSKKGKKKDEFKK